MCDIWKLTEAREISAAELERHLADIERLGVEWVVFTGGEPLMHSDLFRLSTLLRDRGIRTTILSTGLLLERNAARIVESTDEVIVSLDGPAEIHDEIRRVPGAFDEPGQRCRALHRIAPAFPVSARCTVQARNASHLRDTVQAARDIGLRSISFLAADLTSTAFNRPVVWPADRQSSLAPDLAELEGEIESLIAAYPADGFVLESPQKLRRIRLPLPRPLRTGTSRCATVQCALGIRRGRVQWRRPSLLLSSRHRQHGRHDSVRGVEWGGGYRVPRESARGGRPHLPTLCMLAIRFSKHSPGRDERRTLS